MMTRRFPSLRIPALGIALALIVAGCGVDESTTDPSVESIESQLQSPNDTYTMDDEAIPDALQLAFGALDETQVTALNKALADINPGENDDALAETAAPTPNPSTAPDPGTAPDPNAKPPIKHPACPHGFIKGQWKHIAKSFGIFRGAFVDDHGKLIGWIRGVYGQNKLVGKVTAKGGKAHALLTGVYHAGHFQARLRDRAGVIGALRGHYGKNVFAGKWIRFCRPPAIVCPPHLVPHPSGLFCVPLACAPKTCPQGMFCDLCPVICKPLPKLPTGAEPALCGTQAGLVCPQGLRCERKAPAADAPGRCVPEKVCVAICGRPICRRRPPMPPKPTACRHTELGGDQSCKPAFLWKKYAEGTCMAQQRRVTAFAVAVPCGKELFRVAKVTCCEKPAAKNTDGTPAASDTPVQ